MVSTSYSTQRLQLEQQARLRRFLAAYAPATFAFAAVFGVAALALRDLATGLSMIALIIGGLLLTYAWQLARQGVVQQATAIASTGLLVAGLMIVLAQPFLYLTLTLTPVLVVVLALPYLTAKPLQRLMIASSICCIVAVVIGVLVQQGFVVSTLPIWLIETLRFSSAITTVLFVLLLLWQFNNRLTEMVNSLLDANSTLELRGGELVKVNEAMEQQLAAERQLLQLVSTLETPVITMAQGVLLAPIVGHVDTRRAEALTPRLLEVIHAERSKLIILDIKGVAMIDTAVAHALLRTIHSVRLLGCRVAVSGISPSVAATMAQLGIDLAGVRTVYSPHEAFDA